ncbi:MAG: hypothetical protein AAGB51_00910 [Planctomycetota bacterium]
MPTTSSVASEIDAHIHKCGGGYQSWYIGIAADPRARLFADHNVAENGDAWIFRDAGTDAAARQIEDHFLRLGCRGGDGGGSSATKYVYAYKINSHTRE